MSDSELWDALQERANRDHDGHFTVLKFTTNWRVAFGTIGEVDYLDYREAIDQMPVGRTFAEAAQKALAENAVCEWVGTTTPGLARVKRCNGSSHHRRPGAVPLPRLERRRAERAFVDAIAAADKAAANDGFKVDERRELIEFFFWGGACPDMLMNEEE